jgi:hypothetical protein
MEHLISNTHTGHFNKILLLDIKKTHYGYYASVDLGEAKKLCDDYIKSIIDASHYSEAFQELLDASKEMMANIPHGGVSYSVCPECNCWSALCMMRPSRIKGK